MSRSRPGRCLRLLAVPVVLGLTLTACGGNSPSTPAPASTSSGSTAAYTAVSKAEGKTKYPLTIDNCGTTQTFTAPPSKVVILNGTSVAEVESLIVLGLQNRIVASAQSYGVYDDPRMAASVKAVPRRGLTLNNNYEVPREEVLALKPDLVISTWSGGFDARYGVATRAELAKAGSRSWVTPVNCANGKADATAAEKAAYDHQSLDSTYAMLTELGRIFDIPDKAAQVVSDLQARVAKVRSRVAGKPKKSVLIAYPDMSSMTSTGVPAVFNYGISNDVVAAAGGTAPFASRPIAAMATLTKEELAVTKVDVLALGVYAPGEKTAAEAAQIFAAYPQWEASKNKKYVVVSDGPYLGPSNVFAIEKIAAVVHPE